MQNKDLSTTTIESQQVLRDDRKEISYVFKDYNKDPAKGITHGLQKDSIQNAVGATKTKKFKDWKVRFELIEINGKDAITITDEGTVGLTGDIIPDQNDILKKVYDKTLGSNQHLSRFRTVFVSGDNVGPGSYGRGKLVFQACSKSNSILIESKRADGKYIAFKRWMHNASLVESAKIHEDEDAKLFIQHETNDVIKPIKNIGTRITILDLDDSKQERNGLSIKESILRSFEKKPDDECIYSFDQMIMETWWELILKRQVKIELIHKKRRKLVKISDLMTKIISKKDKEDGWRIYEVKNIPITINSTAFKIKLLRFFVYPEGMSLPQNFNHVWTQRKMMKIGEFRGITSHSQIQNRFGGFMIFDDKLEELMLEPEDLTHYGYDYMWKKPLKQVKEIVNEHLDKFLDKLHLGKTKGSGNLSKDLNDVMKEINEQASQLGLISSLGFGKTNQNFSIKIREFKLPNEPKLRVEYIDKIGPVKAEIKNFTQNDINTKIIVRLEQKNNSLKQILIEKDINIISEGEIDVEIDPFKIDKEFRYEELVKFIIEIPEHSVSLSRFLWLGLEPSKEEDSNPIVLEKYQLEFPREDSSRVEVLEQIVSSFQLSNNLNTDLKIDIFHEIYRKTINGLEKLTEYDISDIIIPKMADYSHSNLKIKIDEPTFGFIEQYPPTREYRTCELRLTVKSAIDQGEYIQGENLMSIKKTIFYIGIDNPGNSIFSETLDYDDENDPRTSYWEKSSGAYKFYINTSHPKFRSFEQFDDLKHDFIMEEMLFAAYNICVQEEVYGGVFEEKNKHSNETNTYKGSLNDKYITKGDTISIFHELMGKAILTVNSWHQ